MFERLAAAIWQLILRNGLNRRTRLRVFRKLSTLMIVFLILLNYLEPGKQFRTNGYFIAARWLAKILLEVGLVFLMISEYLMLIRHGSVMKELYVARVASDVTRVAGMLATLVLTVLAHPYFALFVPLVQWYFEFQVLRWSTSAVLAMTPFIFQARRRGQPNPQPLRLYVWYNMDMCVVLNPDEWPEGVPLVMDLPLPLYLWPFMDELPPWVSMKLSQAAAAAG